MGKFSKYETTAQKKEAPWKIHPIWRGIGCLMMLVIPAMAYAGAKLLVAANRWVPVPSDLLARPLGLPVSLAEIIVWILLLFIGFGIFVVFYSLIYRVMGPKKRTVDAQPIRARKGTRKSKAR